MIRRIIKALRLFAAEGLHTADVAIRFAGGADCAAVEDEAVAEIVAFLGGKQGAQDGFDLLLIGLGMQTEAAGDADAVGIDHDCAGHMENIAHDEVRGFSADTGQGDQLVEGIGNIAVVAITQDACHRDDILGFGFVESAGLDVFRQLLGRALCEVRGAGVALKKRGSHHVDARVGTLGGESGRDQTLERIGVHQRADRIGVFFFQRFDRLERDLFFCHGIIPLKDGNLFSVF